MNILSKIMQPLDYENPIKSIKIMEVHLRYLQEQIDFQLSTLINEQQKEVTHGKGNN